MYNVKPLNLAVLIGIYALLLYNGQPYVAGLLYICIVIYILTLKNKHMYSPNLTLLEERELQRIMEDETSGELTDFVNKLLEDRFNMGCQISE